MSIVTCVDNKGFARNLKVGEDYEVVNRDTDSFQIIVASGQRLWYSAYRFTSIRGEQDMGCRCIKKDNTKEWSFTVTSELAIDFDDILSALSYAEPLALVDAGASQYAVIHDTVLHKSLHCKGKLRLPKDCIENIVLGDEDVGLVIQLESPCGRKKVVEFVQSVKNAPWKKKHQGRQEVLVILPKV